MNYKFLSYPIDKHQTDVVFYKEKPPEYVFKNCDDGYDVIVNLLEQKKYFKGEWLDCDIK